MEPKIFTKEDGDIIEFYHGDKLGAIRRAKELGNAHVVWSAPPGESLNCSKRKFGFWVQSPPGMIRVLEEEVYSFE